MTSHECHGRCAVLVSVIAGFVYRLIDVGARRRFSCRECRALKA